MKKKIALGLISVFLMTVFMSASVYAKNSDSRATEKVSILHITGTGWLVEVNDDGTVGKPIKQIEYGHLIEVSVKALPAHLKHGDVPAGEAVELNDGFYVRAADLPFPPDSEARGLAISFGSA